MSLIGVYFVYRFLGVFSHDDDTIGGVGDCRGADVGRRDCVGAVMQAPVDAAAVEQLRALMQRYGQASVLAAVLDLETWARLAQFPSPAPAVWRCPVHGVIGAERVEFSHPACRDCGGTVTDVRE